MIKKLRVTVDGKPYEVTVEVPDEPGQSAAPAAAPGPVSAGPPRPAAPAPVAPPAPAKAGGGPGSVPSPLAGRVTAIAVKPGQVVKEGEQLLTLEAMKMNTFVFAPKAGTVTAIHAAVGDAVDEGQSLAQIS